MRIIAVTNIKGGVGKTTTAVNLAYEAARTGLRTVLWDLDSQGAATWLLRAPGLVRASAKKLVRGDQTLDELLAPTLHDRLEVLPSDRSFRHFDRHLHSHESPAGRLLKLSRALHERCDLLLLDCPPGMSLLTESVLHAADAVVVPLVPAPLSVRMLDELHECVRANGWTDLTVLPFFSMLDRRRALHAQLAATVRVRFPATLATEVPYSSDIERMTVRQAPIAAFAPSSDAARNYARLYAEVALHAGLPAADPTVPASG